MSALFSCDLASVDDTATITCSGEFAFGVSDQVFDALAQVAPDVTNLVFDLASVTFLDSGGVRALLAARELMAQQGGKVIVRDASDPVWRVMEVLGLGDTFVFELTNT